MVSLALEDRLQRDGERLLIQGVPKDAYVPKIMISRKVALLSLASYAIVIRIMEFWAIFFAVAVKAIMASLVPHIHTGSKIWSIFLIIHSFGEWWVMENIQKSFDMREIGFNIGYCKKIINSDEKIIHLIVCVQSSIRVTRSMNNLLIKKRKGK